ncbi:hypothetical protein ACOCJ5_03985 [Knoellia sp. CPCC 206450]|uniref:hypothetical protein n=1 Tax=Knoellia tibetensis TaxID=3404798 RepID=UPI003B43582C
MPASETPWMRACEVMVHAVDLTTGVTFDDLPGDFLEALQADTRSTRGPGAVPEVSGPLPEVTAYLVVRRAPDRPHRPRRRGWCAEVLPSRCRTA